MKQNADAHLKVLKDMLIVQLLLASVPQVETAKIAGVDVNRVNQIAKLLKRKKDRVGKR